jgi:hypothetical protein
MSQLQQADLKETTNPFDDEDVEVLFADSFLISDPSADAVRDGILYAISRDIDITDQLIFNLLYDVNFLLDRYFSWGRDFHPYGLPDPIFEQSELTTTITLSQDELNDIGSGDSAPLPEGEEPPTEPIPGAGTATPYQEILVLKFGGTVDDYKITTVEYIFKHTKDVRDFHLDNEIPFEFEPDFLILLQAAYNYNIITKEIDPIFATEVLDKAAAPDKLKVLSFNIIGTRDRDETDRLFFSGYEYYLIIDIVYEEQDAIGNLLGVSTKRIEYYWELEYEEELDGVVLISLQFVPSPVYWIINFENQGEEYRYVFPSANIWKDIEFDGTDIALPFSNFVSDDVVANEEFFKDFESVDTSESNFFRSDDLYPICPLIINGQSLSSDFRDSVRDPKRELYSKSRTLLKKIGMDLDTLVEQLDTSPSRNDLVAAYLYIGVNMNCSNYTEAEYVWQYTDRRFSESIGGKVYTSFVDNQSSSVATEFNRVMMFNTYGVSTGTGEGSYGTFFKPGKETVRDDRNVVRARIERTIVAAKVLYQDPNREDIDSFKTSGFLEGNIRLTKGDIVIAIAATSTTTYGGKTPKTETEYHYIITKQITTDEWKSHTMLTFRQYTKMYKSNVEKSTLGCMLANADNTFVDVFRLPLQRSLYRLFDGNEQINIANNSIAVAVFGRTVDSIAYYKTASFGNFVRIVIIIVRLVIAYFSAGTSEGSGAGEAASQAADRAIEEAIANIIRDLLVAEIVGFAIKEIAKKDKKFATQVAAVVAIVQLIIAGTNAYNNTFTVDTALGLTQAVATVDSRLNQIKLVEIQEAQREFEKDYQKFNEELKEQRELLEDLTGSTLAYTLGLEDMPTESEIIINETPDEMIARTLVNNVGPYLIQNISTYHDTQLELPDMLRIQDEFI